MPVLASALLLLIVTTGCVALARRRIARYPLGRPGTVDDVTEAALFLLSGIAGAGALALVSWLRPASEPLDPEATGKYVFAPGVREEFGAAAIEAGAAEVVVTDNPINDPASCFRLTGIGPAAEAAGGRVVLPGENAGEWNGPVAQPPSETQKVGAHGIRL